MPALWVRCSSRGIKTGREALNDDSFLFASRNSSTLHEHLKPVLHIPPHL